MFVNDDDMVECPYNNTHRMLRKRLQFHLLKCRLQHTDVELRKCPFNITHLVPEPEFAHHATNCPDRKLITQYKYDAPEQKEEEIMKHAPIDCDENWDDTDVVDYNPRLHLERSNVLLKPEGVCRSERKLFIKKERKRLGDDGDSSDDGIKSEETSSGFKRQKCDYYKDDFETRTRIDDIASYGHETRSRYSRPTHPCSSNLSTQRSRSPINTKSSHLLTGSRRSRELAPPERRSSCLRFHSLPSHPHFDTAQDQYNRRDRRTLNNDQYNSGRDNNNSDYNYHTYYDRDYESDYTMPEAPPPPMISYPQGSLSKYSSPPFQKR